MIEVCIVGFGFSSIPLLRELERTKTEFRIISDGNSVWDTLNEHGRLNFDLVSSYLSSFYSFDLVNEFEEDFFPTAKQFYQMHKRWRTVYGAKVTRDTVTQIDNFSDHSIIHTKSGEQIKARHVVLSTAFRRAIHKELNVVDYNARNETFVFDTMGDSVNLIISKLIAGNNKIILRTNGFVALDKEIRLFGTVPSLDQIEFHNFRYHSQDAYDDIVTDISLSSDSPHFLGTQFPVVIRPYDPDAVFARNGRIVIKYWPIDRYSQKFGDNLEAAICQGYLLNDIAMWLHTGRVIAVPKNTPIDFERKTITYADIERAFDHYIKGDTEVPNLPRIMIDGKTPYEYIYRDNYMGVIPKSLNNVYMIGYTRPTTGGLGNITEMQCLFVHKLITQPAFHEKIHHNLDERIAAYNQHYCGSEKPAKLDHIVYYGFYIDDLARLIGIDYKPTDCQTLDDLIFYYVFPNNTFKYRLKGEYAVDGVAGLIEQITKRYDDFVWALAYLFRGNAVEPAHRKAWLSQMSRYFFNDMRHKDHHRPFLEAYLQTYRQLQNMAVDEVEDAEWDLMVEEACKTRDRVIQNGEEQTHYQCDEDVTNEKEWIASLLASGGGSADIEALPLDTFHANFLSALRHPQEYERAYL